jgi:hypothetical protein
VLLHCLFVLYLTNILAHILCLVICGPENLGPDWQNYKIHDLYQKTGLVSQLCHVNSICENEIELESYAFSNQTVLYNTDLGNINECMKDIISHSDNDNLQGAGET